MHREQQEMGASPDTRDRHTLVPIDHRRLTLIEPFQVSDRSPRGRSQATEVGFGNQLRLERERRRITLASIASVTKISLALLQGLERDDVSRWPSGIFRRSFIRAYAQAVGLDADMVAREFLEYFRDPADPPSPVTAESAPRHARMGSGDAELRLTLADTGATATRGPVPGGARQRWMAGACDLGVLLATGLTFFIAFKHFWMPVAIATLIYYLTSIVLLGNTPGMLLCAPRSRRGDGVRPRVSLTSSARTVAPAMPPDLSATQPDLMFDGSRGARQASVGSNAAQQASHHPTV
jgi:transcriptional regulator with XRE-family HTH domain